MRILCLNLQQSLDPSCAEIFLKFSPRVQFRAPGYIFVDIESTTGIFNGEMQLLKKAVDLAREFAPGATGSIAGSPPLAQVLSHYRPFEITNPDRDLETLAQLPLGVLGELEGLQAWPKRVDVKKIIEFFEGLGLKNLEEVSQFKLTSLRERWGETGVILWKRLALQELQVISPLVPRDPLHSYGYFDDPVSFVPQLFEKIEPQLKYLFHRLEGLGRFSRILDLELVCEYSDATYTLSIEPISPSRDLKLFSDLLKKKMEELVLENPIREFEIFVHDVPEKVEQLDFFEQRDLSQDGWKRLMSFAKQANCQMGFLQMQAAHFPENGFFLKTDWPEEFSPKDLIEMDEGAIQVKTSFAKALTKSPRPSLLLKEPLQLSKIAQEKLKMFTRFPAERIDSSWWKMLKKEETAHNQRDYYFAISEDGQLLWIFQDRMTKSYYLHGYFD